jgi:hypothetical protein
VGGGCEEFEGQNVKEEKGVFKSSLPVKEKNIAEG